MLNVNLLRSITCLLALSLLDGPILLAQAAQIEAAKKTTSGQSADDTASRYRNLEALARGLFYLETMYVDVEKTTERNLIQNALKGMVEQLDPHTMYMPAKAFAQMTSDTQGRFGGVGIIVSDERGKLLVVSPIEDTPAFRAGVKTGDQILEIDDIPIAKLKSADPSERMRGQPGSTMSLTIQRAGEAAPLKFKLVREIIKVKSVRSFELDEGVLYARISSFQESTSQELKDLLEANKDKIKGVILDLRDNPGGLLDQAVEVSDLFIESGIIVSTIGRNRERVEREFAKKRGTFSDFPMIVLINAGSASASEIVAGCLQDHERALVLGTTSFGKGSVQTLMSLPDGSGLKLTVARYYTPKDRSIQAKGITPDVVISQSEPVAQEPSTPAGLSPSKTMPRKEADLKGHIESADLSSVGEQFGTLSQIKKWPQPMQKDRQLTMGFTYLKSYSIFEKRRINR